MLSFSDLGAAHLLAICASVIVAYVIFGVAGFGAALVAGPVLAHFIPVASIVPLLALVDFAAAVSNVSRDARSADIPELRRLVPAMVLGSLIGVGILLLGKPTLLQLALGVFAMGYALYTLSGYKRRAPWPPSVALPFGTVGGVFSAMFGSGGFIYSIYLAGRIEAPDRIRITQSALIGMSTLTRVILFAIAGVYANRALLLTAALLFPLMLAGTALGRRLSKKLPREQFLRVVAGAVLASGAALVWQYWKSSGP